MDHKRMYQDYQESNRHRYERLIKVLCLPYICLKTNAALDEEAFSAGLPVLLKACAGESMR